MNIRGTLTACWSHRPPPSAVSEICYHKTLIASKNQMDIFNVAVKLCGRSHRERRGEMVPGSGFMCTHSLTPNAWCLQSASHCHVELVRSYSCTTISCSEAHGASPVLPSAAARLHGDFNLSWVEKFPPKSLAKSVDVTGRGNTVCHIELGTGLFRGTTLSIR